MSELGLPALLYLVVLVVLIPLATLKAKRHLDAGRPVAPRARRLQSVILLQVVMLWLGLLIERLWELKLVPPPALDGRGTLWAAGLFAGLCALIPLRWRGASPAERQRIGLLMPHDGRELLVWILIACLAGFGEELNYRGVLVAVLTATTGNWWVAAGLSVAAFAIAHCQQSWRKAAYVAASSVVFQVAVVQTGSLLPAMLAHAAYDIVAGVVLGRLTRDLPAAPPAAA